MVDPERYPGQHHNKYTGQVGLEHEVADVPAQFETERQTLVDARRQLLLKCPNFSECVVTLAQVCDCSTMRLNALANNLCKFRVRVSVLVHSLLCLLHFIRSFKV